MQEEVSDDWGEPLGLALAPGTQLAGFTLEAPLATGGAGTVYRASRGGQRVALKVIPQDAWGEREVDALRRVRHAPVVGLLGYGGWPEKRPRYLVLTLELIEGLALDSWARVHNPSARQLVHQVLLPLTRALAQVHAAGVVHRDVKESNVVIRHGDGRPVLVDFGAACYPGAPRITERLPPGTREYRSPEMWRFALEWDGGHYAASPADDLWALGVTLYWLLTRQLPFGDRSGPLVKRVLEQPPRPVRELNPRVPGALGAVCLRMLEKPPPARYPSADALAQALEEVLAQADDTWGEPLFAPEPREEGALVTPARGLPASAGDESPPQGVETAARRAMRGSGLVALAGVLSLLMWKLAWRPAPPEEARPEPLRAVSSPSALPRQDGPRQEFALAQPTRDVGPDAGPSRSSAPAPVAHATHSEETPVRQSHPSRSSLATALVAGSLCMGSGCASAPQTAGEPPPSPIPCPKGAAQTYRSHHLGLAASVGLERTTDGGGLVRNGDVLRVTVLDPWGDLPKGIPLLGRAWFGRDRVYGRLTQLLLPSGESLPICFDLNVNGPGVPMDRGSTRTVAITTIWVVGAFMVRESRYE